MQLATSAGQTNCAYCLFNAARIDRDDKSEKMFSLQFEKPYTQFYGMKEKNSNVFSNCLSNFFGSELPSGCRIRIRRAAAIRRRRRRRRAAVTAWLSLRQAPGSSSR